MLRRVTFIISIYKFLLTGLPQMILPQITRGHRATRILDSDPSTALPPTGPVVPGVSRAQSKTTFKRLSQVKLRGNTQGASRRAPAPKLQTGSDRTGSPAFCDRT